MRRPNSERHVMRGDWRCTSFRGGLRSLGPACSAMRSTSCGPMDTLRWRIARGGASRSRRISTGARLPWPIVRRLLEPNEAAPRRDLDGFGAARDAETLEQMAQGRLYPAVADRE